MTSAAIEGGRGQPKADGAKCGRPQIGIRSLEKCSKIAKNSVISEKFRLRRGFLVFFSIAQLPPYLKLIQEICQCIIYDCSGLISWLGDNWFLKYEKTGRHGATVNSLNIKMHFTFTNYVWCGSCFSDSPRAPFGSANTMWCTGTYWYSDTW